MFKGSIVALVTPFSNGEIDEIRGGQYGAGGGNVFHSPIFGGKVLP